MAVLQQELGGTEEEGSQPTQSRESTPTSDQPRVYPVFARLRPYLEEAWKLAGRGEVFVVGGLQGDAYRATAQKPGGWVNTNLRSVMLKLIRRAWLLPWPKVFQNLRASCETDLMQNYPIHVVTAWIGNTPKIALGHYLQTLDGDFQKAIHRGDAEDDARARDAKSDAGRSRHNSAGNNTHDGTLRK